MDLRWEGYKKVRGQVCKRIKERLQRLNLGDFFQYREYLERNTGEWEELEPLTHISISRFFRDKRSWDILGERILPGLAYEKAREGTHLRVWSAGCASGEEPYSFAILWEQQIVPYYPDVKLELLATDANDHLLKRAAEARYTAGSLREMPEEWKQEAFVKENATCRLIDKYQKLANFKKQDIKQEMPEGEYDIIFCKNLVGMYFSRGLAIDTFNKVSSKMNKGGFLLLGNHEEFPEEATKNIKVYDRGTHIYRKE